LSRVLLIRHAAFDGVGELLVGRTAGVRLNAVGTAQARALAATLAHEPLAGVYSSPLERALETATHIAEPHGLEPVVVDAFTELEVGEWTGRTVTSLAADPHWQAFNTARSVTRIPGGDLMPDVQARAMAALLTLRERHGDATIAVVSHGDVIRGVLAYALAMPIDAMLRLTVEPASMSTLLLTAGAPCVIDVNRRVVPMEPR
jgi:broad specificity phosphatase PhoE